MRVEFSRRLRPDSPRFVLMIEIPDSAAAELHARKVSLEARAYELAFETTYVDRSNKPDHQMSLMSAQEEGSKTLSRLANLVCWLPTRAGLGSLKGHPRSKSSLIKVGNQDKKIRDPRVREIALHRSGQSCGIFHKRYSRYDRGRSFGCVGPLRKGFYR
jgi:hypothetical protein